MQRPALILAAVSVAAALAAGLGARIGGAPAVAQVVTGDVVAGQRIAETWCANCHLVGTRSTGPATDTAPSFVSIARRPSTTTISLRAFLQSPHRQMPNYQLSRAETDDVIAYILSLRGR